MTEKEQREMIVFKANTLARAQIRDEKQMLSIQQQKALLFFVSKIKPTDNAFAVYTFRLSDFCRVCGINMGGGSGIRYVLTALQNLRDKSIWLRRPNGDYTLCGWLNKVDVTHDGYVKVRFDEDMKPFLLELEKNFTAFALKPCLAMKSRYSIRLYEVLKSYESLGEVTLSVQELRDLLGVLGKYELFGNFRQKALNPALQEIENYTDLSIDISFEKAGSRVDSVTFRITKKDPMVWYQTWHDLDFMLDKGAST